jgi:hypothetical protein
MLFISSASTRLESHTLLVFTTTDYIGYAINESGKGVYFVGNREFKSFFDLNDKLLHLFFAIVFGATSELRELMFCSVSAVEQ